MIKLLSIAVVEIQMQGVPVVEGSETPSVQRVEQPETSLVDNNEQVQAQLESGQVAISIPVATEPSRGNCQKNA